MTINYVNGKIEMTKTEAKAASIYGSDAYNDLQNAKRDNPGFAVVVVKTAKKRDCFKGLTIEFMKDYIEKHDDEEKSNMADFNRLCGKDEEGKALNMSAASYGEIRMWFLSAYPEFEAYTQKRDELLNSIRQANKAKRAAA